MSAARPPSSEASPSAPSVARALTLARIAMAIAVVGALAIALRGHEASGRADGRASGGRPSIVLVTFDTTRADHTSAYGYGRPTTPNMAKLLPDAVRFDAAHAPMPTTLPSHSALFTARNPRSLGLLKNGQVLSDDALTLAEVLSTAGWRTAGFVSSFVLDRRFGPMQGFATYDDHFSDVPCKMLGKNWEGRDLETSFCRRGEETMAHAVAWLEENGYLADRAGDGAGADGAAARPPFFLWVHLFDPHNPYVPPDQQKALFPPLGENPSALERDIADYDGEIRYADAQLGTLVDRLARAGRLDDTLLVVTADHGEGLMQHGWMHHGMQIYEEVVHVPLIVRWPVRVRGGRTIAAPVGLVDVAPTLLDLAGVGATLPAAEGKSLAGVLVDGGSPDPERPIFLQRRLYESEVVRDIAVKGAKYGVRQGAWKYIEAKEEGTRELYDLASDPGERDNAVDRDPERARRLEALIGAWLAHDATGMGTRVTPDDAERLRALGYVE